MNAKNLWLKFVIVLAVVVVCLLGLGMRGLMWGIDLRGGHSLEFEVRTNADEIEALDKQVAELRASLAAEQDAAARTKIEAEIERAKMERKRLETAGSADRTLVQNVIDVLKQRVDPMGLQNLEWRPVGADRFQVRMPAASEETRQRKQAYLAALERLQQQNIKPSGLTRLLSEPDPARREAMIADMAGLVSLPKADAVGEETAAAIAEARRNLAADLKALAAAHDAVQAARQAASQAASTQDAQAIAAGRADLKNKLVAYEARLRDVLESNISRQEITDLLALYVSPREAKALDKKGPQEAENRTALFEKRLGEFREAHQARRAIIDRVVELYKQWADVRQSLEDPEDLKRLIAKAGVLEFRVAPYLPGIGKEPTISRDELERVFASLDNEGAAGLRKRNAPLQWFPLREKDEKLGGLITRDGPDGRRYVLLYNRPGDVMLHQPGRGGWMLKDARPDVDRNNRPAVGFTMNQAGGELMANLTTAHRGHSMAILLDNEVYSAPVIQAVISDRGIITGRFTQEEVNDLVRTLKAGSLPARLNPEPVSVMSFGPTLGKVNRDMGIRAAWIGLIVVAAFMLVYYLFAGAIADVALLLNIILVLGAMSWLQARFTLPGLAGIILTIGIAVDANVLIFERLREEQEKGQSVRMALKNAYERAFSAIFDANITTLVTCFILGWVGTEEIRGFAITLGLGVVFSMFTALVVTRWVFQLLLDTRVLTKPLPMLRIVGVPRINWMGKRYFFWGLSAVFIAIGIASLAAQKSDIWGIEFSSGTQVTVQLREDALFDGELPNDELVRRRFLAKAEEMDTDGELRKLIDSAVISTVYNPLRAQQMMTDFDRDEDARISLEEWKSVGRAEEAFVKLDPDGDGLLTGAEIRADSFPDLAFQISTTETNLGRIRDVVSAALGTAMIERPSCEFEVVQSREISALGVDVDARGYGRVLPEAVEAADARYRDVLRDAVGGVVLVVEKVSPALTPTDLDNRIRDMRLQPDFEGQQNPTAVIPLTPAERGAFSSFAIVVSPSERGMVEDPDAWDAFAASELELIRESLEQGESMVATVFDPAIAGKATDRAILAVLLSCAAIVLYLWLRFGSLTWGLAAVVCLVHDVLIVVGLVAASAWLHSTLIGRALGIESFKIDLAMVAAFLTVIGYSVNDTIVIFDRIRENRGKLTTITGQVINLSINQSLARTLLTSITTLIVVIIMYVFGGQGIHAFSYALLVGILFGTYSSVAVASPMLMGLKKALVQKVVKAEAPTEPVAGK